jgi:hypothetical protein
MKLTPADLRYAIDDLRAQGAGDGCNSFIRSGAGPARSGIPAGHRPALRQQGESCKASGIEVRPASSSFVQPFNLKKYFKPDRGIPMISNQFQSKNMKPEDFRQAIDERFSDVRTKGKAMPQGARCAGKVCRSATNSTFAGRSRTIGGKDRVIRRNPTIEFLPT